MCDQLVASPRFVETEKRDPCMWKRFNVIPVASLAFCAGVGLTLAAQANLAEEADRAEEAWVQARTSGDRSITPHCLMRDSCGRSLTDGWQTSSKAWRASRRDGVR